MLNADEQVMEHFVSPLSREQSDGFVDRVQRAIEQRGYDFWAVELVGEAGCIGTIGATPVPDTVPCAPAIEIGWRLARPFWRRGLALEGARATVEFVFGELGHEDLVAYTANGNVASRGVMERLGMQRDPAEDFVHASVPADNPLNPHVLYRLTRSQWQAAGH